MGGLLCCEKLSSFMLSHLFIFALLPALTPLKGPGQVCRCPPPGVSDICLWEITDVLGLLGAPVGDPTMGMFLLDPQPFSFVINKRPVEACGQGPMQPKVTPCQVQMP